jgi:hypothetical protein
LPSRASRRLVGLGLLPFVLVAGGCTDNVACVFANGCTGPSSNGNSAIPPVDGEWILEAAPRILGVFPDGGQSAGTTPIVIVFSETMQNNSLGDAFEIVPLAGGGLGGQPLRGVPQVLLAEGRVLVLLPQGTQSQAPLAIGDYLVRLAQDANVLDLTGQVLNADLGARVGNFTVVANPPTVPRVLTTFPANAAENQGDTTQFVAVFDRPLDAQTVDPGSFDVRVNGANPTNDPAAVPLQIGGGTGTFRDTRVFLWRSVDTSGNPASLGKGAAVEVRLSPSGDPIQDEDGNNLAATTVSFDVLPFAAPLSASLLSDPNDAIGLANLTDGNPEELELEVLFDMAQTNDFLDLYLFGTQATDAENPPVIALLRTHRLTGTTPIASLILAREDIPILSSNSSPSSVRFKDGAVTFAFVLRRSGVATPVRLLDLDPDPGTILDPELDTTAPTVRRLLGTTNTASFRSDLRGLSLAGDADETLRSVEVDTPLGNNDPLAPVVGSDAAGLFLAAPVSLGRAPDEGTSFTFVARDHAQNAATPLAGGYRQFGALGPDPFTPGQSVEVEVFDSGDLLPLSNVTVLVHSDAGDGLNYPFFRSATTGLDGRVTVTTAGAPSSGAILTLVRNGYDLFTLHGVPTTRVSIPLRPSSQGLARIAGGVRTEVPSALIIAGLDMRFDDSRRSVDLPRGFLDTGCTTGDGLSCTHAEATILEDRLGARSFFAGDFSQAVFDPAELLQAFVLSVPHAPVAPNGIQFAFLELGGVLADGKTTEHAQEVPEFLFRLPAASGVQAPFQDDLDTTGEPFVSVDVLIPGLSGSIAVGTGIALGAPDLWTIRSAFPGAVTAAGALGRQGVVDTDPFVRVELVDQEGDAAGIRPRLSTIQAGGPQPEFLALAAPTLLAPAAQGTTGGQAFTLRLRHVIGDERSVGGLYRVEMRDSSSRGWSLWRFDASGSADVELRVVDPADGGVVGLANGNLTARMSAYAWSGLVATDFFWTDVERRFELFARAQPVSFAKP